MSIALNNESIPFGGETANEVIEYAFQIYLLGHLDERLFLFFCLMNDRYEA